MKVVNSAMSSELSCASSAPDLTCASAGSSGWMSETSSAGVEPSTPATEIASYWPSRSKSVCAVATSKIANVALPSDLTSPYCAIPTTSKSCFGFSVEIAIVSPRAKSSRSAVPGVDDDLAVVLGPAALEQVERVEDVVLGRGVEAEAEARRAVRVDRLPVLADDLRVELVVDPAHREVDRVDPPDLVEERRVDRRRLGLLEVDGDVRRLAADDDVRAGVRVGEDARERLVDRVREDVGAADHRDAEDDRERGQDGPDLAAEHAPQGEARHVRAISSIVSVISAWLAPWSSRTICPSAR